MMGKVKKFTKIKDKGALSELENESVSSYFYTAWIVIFACGFGALNCFHQYNMFENDRHFSHLSSLEREMTFRTEMGLYYYYYKTLVEAPSFVQGINSLIFNNLTEFPKTINTLKRFNLYPEVILGLGFRTFTYVATIFNWKTTECFVVSRGDDFSTVLSCEGIGDPAYFYITSVFVWNSSVGALIFIFGVVLSDSILGGIFSAASFFFNHGECTRVQWTPPLRESFAFPFWLVVMICVTLVLKSRYPAIIGKYFIALFSAGFLLTWQFAQFALLTQTLCIYTIYLLELTTEDTVKKIFHGQMIGLAFAFMLLFGNTLLLNSFYATVLLTSYVLISCEKQLSFNYRILKLVTHGFLLCAGSLLLKFLIGAITGVEDDKHIWNLLRAKFSTYSDFHTLLYTCAVEFDFMEKETPIVLTKTLLLPTAFFVCWAVIIKVFKSCLEKQESQQPEVIYNLLQLIAFGIMAALFMRLKLFFTPQLCVFVSLLASRQYWGKSRTEFMYGTCGILLALMSVQGLQNIWRQQDILGEYSNPQLEEMLLWVNESTSKDAVFAGPMPTMANLILSTNRPIVNHPHYEDSNARQRNLQVYSLYSRKPAQEVHDLLASMGVQFAVLGKPWCFGENKPGCSMVELWDVQEPSYQNHPSLCQKLATNPAPFKSVFSNDQYIVLKVMRP